MGLGLFPTDTGDRRSPQQGHALIIFHCYGCGNIGSPLLPSDRPPLTGIAPNHQRGVSVGPTEHPLTFYAGTRVFRAVREDALPAIEPAQPDVKLMFDSAKLPHLINLDE